MSYNPNANVRELVQPEDVADLEEWQAHNPRLSLSVRVWLWTRCRADETGVAVWDVGELRELLGVDVQTLSRALRAAEAKHLLRGGSTARRTVLR